MESYAHSVPVVMYHHVSPSPGALSITPEHFDSQMNWLARNGYVTLTADEFARFLHGAAMPDKSILLTFDDGYLDNYIHAHPCLERYGLNAIMFLVTGRVHDGPARSVLTRDAGAEHSHPECERLIRGGQADDVTVRWSEIDLMRAAGTFEFHSHTHSHRRWDLSCTNAASKFRDISTDIETSKLILTEKMGAASTHLCWPEGYYDDDYIAAARAAGFEYLYTTRNTRRNVAGSDPHQIHRMADNGKNGEWLAGKVQRYQHVQWGAAYYWFKRFREFGSSALS
ncbi:polysaccharide deacetylase family protein [Paraburkholderia sediminicola]|uniref:polysaccharide deacetylase family protein n=2 Tax=Paraburkholderia sediminicola TaxID=458836 RepID=UPI0038BBBA25